MPSLPGGTTVLQRNTVLQRGVMLGHRHQESMRARARNHSPHFFGKEAMAKLEDGEPKALLVAIVAELMQLFAL